MDLFALHYASNCPLPKRNPIPVVSETLDFLSSTIFQNKEHIQLGKQEGLGFFRLCFTLLCVRYISMYQKERGRLAWSIHFSGYLGMVFWKRNMSLKPSVISCEISPLSDRADCCTSYFLYRCRGKKRQLRATRTFSSVYWSPQLPHEMLPERQFSWRQAVLINPS